MQLQGYIDSLDIAGSMRRIDIRTNGAWQVMQDRGTTGSVGYADPVVLDGDGNGCMQLGRNWWQRRRL